MIGNDREPSITDSRLYGGPQIIPICAILCPISGKKSDGRIYVPTGTSLSVLSKTTKVGKPGGEKDQGVHCRRVCEGNVVHWPHQSVVVQLRLLLLLLLLLQ